MSYGGWFIGHAVGTGHKNVMTRTLQYKTSFDPETCLKLARKLVAAKIHNCRTLLRRNWKTPEGEEGRAPADLLAGHEKRYRPGRPGQRHRRTAGRRGQRGKTLFRISPSHDLPVTGEASKWASIFAAETGGRPKTR